MESTLDLLVFMDGLGWELVQDHAFLQEECQHRRSLSSVLGYSCACVPTILTGRRPAEHGHFTFWVHAPDSSPFGPLRWLELLPERVSGSGRFRNLLSRVVARARGYTGYFQLYNVPFGMMPRLDYVEKKDLYRPGGIVSGAPTLLDDLAVAGVSAYVSDWRRPDPYNVDDMRHKLQELRPRFAFLYLAGLDGALHRLGTRAPEIGERLRWYEDRLREVLAAARRHYREVRFALVSDHGMSDVTRLVDVESALASAGLRQEIDYLAIFDSTMARFWVLHEGASDRLDAVLQGLPHGRLLPYAELEALGCGFADARYGEKIFLTDPGAIVFPNHMGRQPIAGMHGYHPGEPCTRAVFLSTHDRGGVPEGLWDIRSVIRARALEGSAATA